MEKVEAVVAEMEEKTKETYYASAFVPNFANKLFSGEDRAVKVEKLMDVLKREQREQCEGLGVYEFVNLMATMERQTKSKKVGEEGEGES